MAPLRPALIIGAHGSKASGWAERVEEFVGHVGETPGVSDAFELNGSLDLSITGEAPCAISGSLSTAVTLETTTVNGSLASGGLDVVMTDLVFENAALLGTCQVPESGTVAFGDTTIVFSGDGTGSVTVAGVTTDAVPLCGGGLF